MLPNKWVLAINKYSSSTQNIQAESNWKSVIKSILMIGLTNGIVLVSLLLLSLKLIAPFINNQIENPIIGQVVIMVICLGAASPFLWAFMAKRPNTLAYKELWLDSQYNHGPLVVLEILRSVLGVLFIGFWMERLFSTLTAILVAVPIIVLVLFLFSKKIQSFYQRLEGRFLSNLMARETEEEENFVRNANPLQRQFNPQSELSPWDAHLVDMQVNVQADYIGKPLIELAWREKYGINIGYIKRGDKLIYAPGKNNKLLPYDHVGIIGSDEQLNQFKPIFDRMEAIDPSGPDIEDIIIQKIVVDEHNRLKGQSIRDSAIRERTNGLVVGIQRKMQRILNPSSDTVFEWEDIVWIVGERKKIQELNKV